MSLATFNFLVFAGTFVGIGFLASGRSDLKTAGICLTAICGFFWVLSLLQVFLALGLAAAVPSSKEVLDQQQKFLDERRRKKREEQ
jgi:hypothetical protein